MCIWIRLVDCIWECKLILMVKNLPESLLFTMTYDTSGGSREGARTLIFKPNWGRRVEKNVLEIPLPPPPLSKGLNDRFPPPPLPSTPAPLPLSRGLDLALCTIQILVWYVRMLTITLFSFANVLVNLSLPKFLQLSQALRVFSLHARGPAFEHYAAQFQDECNKVTC